MVGPEGLVESCEYAIAEIHNAMQAENNFLVIWFGLSVKMIFESVSA